VTQRQMLLGQYIACLLEDGTIRKGTDVGDVAKVVIYAVRDDLPAVMAPVIREWVSQKAGQMFDRFAAIVKGKLD